MAITAERSEQAQTIRLSGGVDISVAAELKKALMEALDGQGAEPGVRVDVSAVESADVTAVQVLYAAKNQAKARGLEFNIDGPWNAELELRFDEAGIHLSQIFIAPKEEMGNTIGLEH